MEDDGRVEKDKVLDDMYNPDIGWVSRAARDYYYDKYATPEEREQMDAEDKRGDRWLFIIVMVFCIFIAGVTISLLIL